MTAFTAQWRLCTTKLIAETVFSIKPSVKWGYDIMEEMNKFYWYDWMIISENGVLLIKLPRWLTALARILIHRGRRGRDATTAVQLALLRLCAYPTHTHTHRHTHTLTHTPQQTHSCCNPALTGGCKLRSNSWIRTLEQAVFSGYHCCRGTLIS